MEATISHTYDGSTGREVWTQVTAERTALPDGYYRINGRLYRVQDGMFLHNTTGGRLYIRRPGPATPPVRPPWIPS